ncbi:DNA polymerase family A-domain-containing protein [Mycena metata]|uniref:Mitochondrial DNA polymerase catalytic subunit n=1 Tax=Mycena metata TaxID=1033252 RepID=A0AAD7J9U5_9AGAR|nr:DNA polymerase family A-domain-containing protein [Mycena metata]
MFGAARTASASGIRSLHGARPLSVQVQRVKPPTPQLQPVRPKNVQDASASGSATTRKEYIKRNELGVQMLSRPLHSQIFNNVSFPTPDKAYINIALQHLEQHGLDPSQGSTLPDTSFTLPPLQGNNLLEHFYRIGSSLSQPYLRLAREFAAESLPPIPDGTEWNIHQSGWTKYYYMPDGSSYSEAVDYPRKDDGSPEDLLTFDVETLPKYHPNAVMACAASPSAWYAWVSPWLLNESEDPVQLIPLGDPPVPRIIVGHNVSYDRGRTKEEYHLDGTQNRWLDTMALHVAVQGISSNQRPAWMKWRKNRQAEKEREEEARMVLGGMLQELTTRWEVETDVEKKEDLSKLMERLEDSLAAHPPSEGLEHSRSEPGEEDDGDSVKTWEALTSANSLADVAALHKVPLHAPKSTRDDFMKLPPSAIVASLPDYLSYCASDVQATHAIFAKVLPAFLIQCPHPASFAGILSMGSSFLCVDEGWEKYLEQAEAVYMGLENAVKSRLADLARQALSLFLENPGEEKWKDDVWLSQLDWTPKVAGKSRGVFPPDSGEAVAPTETTPAQDSSPTEATSRQLPSWYTDIRDSPFSSRSIDRILPLLLELSYNGQPIQYSPKEHWHYLSPKDQSVTRFETAGTRKTRTVLGPKHALKSLEDGRMDSRDAKLAERISRGERDEKVAKKVQALADRALHKWQKGATTVLQDSWLGQLDWTLVADDTVGSVPPPPKKRVKKEMPAKPAPVLWPKWYWEATKPKKDMPPGTLDITVRNRIAPLLLKLSWLNWPLFHSREHGWMFRVPASASFATRSNPLSFYDPADDALAEETLRGGYIFYKLPHKDGEKANVGSPLGKTFMKYSKDGTLKSPGTEAMEALDMNAMCSYWISARDRILNQNVVWQDKNTDRDLGFTDDRDGKKWGIILPQVITMGTVTRRAIEKTWLTASNAKKNRVGSELKAMVRAPPGYAIVGADVDSEELWISSCMGDAQFGLHGATAIGWMTLEGTKAAGTDLHSKTASILGISRDQAKVFNYSRIYGAGMRHAILLLLQNSAGMLQEEAQKLATNLYASTKGKNTHRTDIFDRKFWFGGTESFLFNKLEEIAVSDKPQTPALGCGVTYALSKDYLPSDFGSDYMPSRINWVVQSSGVDYLHLLIVSMDYLIRKYDIHARYLISVHDELRYLVSEKDRYRAALALQIANVWTRSLFAYKLGMDDLPQGVAFFSAVDVDWVLRKEVDMPCVTPSQPNPIAPGESLNIEAVLEKTNGSLLKDGGPMPQTSDLPFEGSLDGYTESDCLVHRAKGASFLQAQAASDFGEVKHLAQLESGRKFVGGIGKDGKKKAKRKAVPVGNGDGVDWSRVIDDLLSDSRTVEDVLNDLHAPR